MPKIMITGSRDWEDVPVIRQALYNAFVELGADNETVLLSGHCSSGADLFAETIWNDEMGLPVELFPADWESFGNYAGPKRNQQMVDEKPDIVLAFPKGKSVGTRGTIRMAEQAGLDVRVFDE